jgi:hypothetical protein
LLVICFGSVIAFGGGKACDAAGTLKKALPTVVIVMTIANGNHLRMKVLRQPVEKKSFPTRTLDATAKACREGETPASEVIGSR